LTNAFVYWAKKRARGCIFHLATFNAYTTTQFFKTSEERRGYRVSTRDEGKPDGVVQYRLKRVVIYKKVDFSSGDVDVPQESDGLEMTWE
jgi:hypothetical protein